MQTPDYKQFDYGQFRQAAESDRDQPAQLFDALRDLAQTTIGARLFTIMTFDPRTRAARRIYSNMPEAYPVSGTKPANETDWSRQVLTEKRTFVANDIESIAQVFNDYELIRSLGCESVINVPVVVAGEIIGTINCLDVAGHYTEERVRAAEALKLPGAVCLLFLQQNRASGDQ